MGQAHGKNTGEPNLIFGGLFQDQYCCVQKQTLGNESLEAESFAGAPILKGFLCVYHVKS